MSLPCIQLLHQELRQAFRICALRHHQLSRSQTLDAVVQYKRLNRPPSSNLLSLAFGRRGHADSAAPNTTRRRISDIEREWRRERLKTLKGAKEGPHTQSIEVSPEAQRMPVTPRILVYHAGTGKMALVGLMNIFTLLLFAGSCVVVAPAFYASEHGWWTVPLVIACGSIPLALTRYTSRSFVTWAHLVLPRSAQRSREAALEYSQHLPDNATLHLAYIRHGIFARRVEVELGNLKPASAKFKPVTFKNSDPNADRGPWYARTPKEFFVSPRSGVGRASKSVVPGVWENVYKKITAGQELTYWSM